MSTTGRNQELFDRIGALQQKLVDDLSPELLEDPKLADALNQRIEDLLSGVVEKQAQKQGPQDGGLSELVGIGPDAANRIKMTHLPFGIEDYDESVSSDRILAIADLYYLYQHEKVGVFRAVNKLQQLFVAGSVRLSGGKGAFRLYQYDRRRVLRYTQKQRLQTYRRALGYGIVPVMKQAKANQQLHGLFTQFIGTVARFWSDKRIADVIRGGAYDPSFGSIASVRRSGLDLRNNLKWASYGHISVFRIEIMQLLHEAFSIFGAPDVRKLFGAESAWDVIEEVLLRYYGTKVNASQRHRLAVSGRHIIRWLAQEHILNTSQAEFEALLQDIALDVEEWLTSAEALGIASRADRKAVVTIASQPTSRSPLKSAAPA